MRCGKRLSVQRNRSLDRCLDHAIAEEKINVFVWVLILSPWVALVLLVLHDATRGPRDGELAVGAGSSSSDSIRLGAPSAVGQTSVTAQKRKPSRRRGGRISATIPELELAIAEAVRKAAPECEAFIGVTLQQATPKLRHDVNWRIRGVRFGSANRELANEALGTIVERLQQEFYLTEH